MYIYNITYRYDIIEEKEKPCRLALTGPKQFACIAKICAQ